METERKDHRFYAFLKALIRFFYPKIEVVGLENLPKDEPVIAVGNHCQIHGPIMTILNFPGRRVVWCRGEMMNAKEIPDYAFTDFWSFKPKWTHGFFRLLSHLITPLAIQILDSSETLPVYRDNRVITTFRQSVARLQEGISLVIFPEHNKKFNNIIYDFLDKFIDVARFYYKKTQKCALFVPMYLAPRLRKMLIGTPIRFDPTAPIEEERVRIKDYLMSEITALARSLPKHTVIPYRNIARRDYPTNI